jgi:hypothetical protein
MRDLWDSFWDRCTYLINYYNFPFSFYAFMSLYMDMVYITSVACCNHEEKWKVIDNPCIALDTIELLNYHELWLHNLELVVLLCGETLILTLFNEYSLNMKSTQYFMYRYFSKIWYFSYQVESNEICFLMNPCYSNFATFFLQNSGNKLLQVMACYFILPEKSYCLNPETAWWCLKDSCVYEKIRTNIHKHIIDAQLEQDFIFTLTFILIVNVDFNKLVWQPDIYAFCKDTHIYA